MSETVFMRRNSAMWPQPHTADVHPNEVENFKAAGFVEATPLPEMTDEEKATSDAKLKAQDAMLAKVKATAQKKAWGAKAPPPPPGPPSA